MLAYAAHRRPHRRVRPTTLALIIGGHAVAIGLLAAAKVEVGPGNTVVDTIVEFIPKPIEEVPPPPAPPQPKQQEQRTQPQSHIDQPTPVVPLDNSGPAFDLGPPTKEIVSDIRQALDVPLGPVVSDPPKPAPVKVAARSVTPADLLRPPYPDSKRRMDEETVLRLRLQIDERGRVVGVEPVGSADPEFLAAARQHLLRHWRYRPATEDGRPVASAMTITLRFQLED